MKDANTRRTRRALRLVSVALVLLPSGGLAEEASAPRDPRGAYAGVWILDLEASDPVGPLMELMEAPWLARKLADSMTPTLTITPHGERGIRMLNENPIRTTDEPMPADGIERERKDPLGRKVVASQVWNDAGELVITQKNHVDAERFVLITSTWTRAGDRLQLTNTAATENGPLVIRRIFRPKR